MVHVQYNTEDKFYEEESINSSKIVKVLHNYSNTINSTNYNKYFKIH